MEAPLPTRKQLSRLLAEKADFIAISTYNGIALRYARDVLAAIKEAGSDMPVLIGGKLNEIPEDSNWPPGGCQSRHRSAGCFALRNTRSDDHIYRKFHKNHKEGNESMTRWTGVFYRYHEAQAGWRA